MQFPDSRMSSDDRVVTRERKEIIQDILEQLAVKDRDILRALFLEDADKDDICTRFEVDRDYLRVLVHRAKLRFREVYEKKGLAAF